MTYPTKNCAHWIPFKERRVLNKDAVRWRCSLLRTRFRKKWGAIPNGRERGIQELLPQDAFIEPPQAYPWKKELLCIHVPVNDTDAGGGEMGLGHPEFDRFCKKIAVGRTTICTKVRGDPSRSYSFCLSVGFFRRRNGGFWHDFPLFLPIFTFLIQLKQLKRHSFFKALMCCGRSEADQFFRPQGCRLIVASVSCQPLSPIYMSCSIDLKPCTVYHDGRNTIQTKNKKQQW